jgi:serine/threonine-protein kinase RsbW
MRKKLGRSTHLVHAAAPPTPGGALLFDRSFPSGRDEKNEALNALLDALSGAKIMAGDSDEARARLCLDEALVNAVTHGNQSDPAKSVRVRAFLAADIWSVLIEDEGTGFREEDLPDPSAPENLLEESGRGVHLIRSMMDSAGYWKNGSALLMSRHINREAKT